MGSVGAPVLVTAPRVLVTLTSNRNPTMEGEPATFTVWKRFAKPVALLLTLFAVPVAFFHHITQGPKEPQPADRPDPRNQP